MNENYRGSIAVLGQGYVGLPLALAAREAGWNVIGLDKNLSLVSELNRGVSHVEDVSSEDLRRALDGGMRIESNMELIGEANVVVICVPTPVDDLGQPNLQYLDSAIESIAMFAKSGTLVINESTSFPGTLRDFIAPRILEKSPEINLDFAISPERIDPGNRKWNYRNTPRLVSGLTERAKARAQEFYSTFCAVSYTHLTLPTKA